MWGQNIQAPTQGEVRSKIERAKERIETEAERPSVLANHGFHTGIK